jgi:hypothetical protein
MSDQHRRPILRIENRLGRADVILERGQRQLHGADAISPGFEDRRDIVPAAFVGEGAGHQHDIFGDARVLDAGGGRGALSLSLAARGCEVVLIDPDFGLDGGGDGEAPRRFLAHAAARGVVARHGGRTADQEDCVLRGGVRAM